MKCVWEQLREEIMAEPLTETYRRIDDTIRLQQHAAPVQRTEVDYDFTEKVSEHLRNVDRVRDSHAFIDHWPRDANSGRRYYLNSRLPDRVLVDSIMTWQQHLQMWGRLTWMHHCTEHGRCNSSPP